MRRSWMLNMTIFALVLSTSMTFAGEKKDKEPTMQETVDYMKKLYGEYHKTDAQFEYLFDVSQCQMSYGWRSRTEGWVNRCEVPLQTVQLDERLTSTEDISGPYERFIYFHTLDDNISCSFGSEGGKSQVMDMDSIEFPEKGFKFVARKGFQKAFVYLIKLCKKTGTPKDAAAPR